MSYVYSESAIYFNALTSNIFFISLCILHSSSAIYLYFGSPSSMFFPDPLLPIMLIAGLLITTAPIYLGGWSPRRSILDVSCLTSSCVKFSMSASTLEIMSSTDTDYGVTANFPWKALIWKVNHRALCIHRWSHRFFVATTLKLLLFSSSTDHSWFYCVWIPTKYETISKHPTGSILTKTDLLIKPLIEISSYEWSSAADARRFASSKIHKADVLFFPSSRKHWQSI